MFLTHTSEVKQIIFENKRENVNSFTRGRFADHLINFHSVLLCSWIQLNFSCA